MLSWADTNGLRIAAYLVAAVLSFAAGRRQDPADPATWPPFWPLTALLLLTMAIGRAGGIAEWVADLARGQAAGGGWYEARRPLQAAVVAIVGGVWAVSVAVACWRIPERRRRYLPMTVLVMTIGAFVAVRMVSLHQVDSLLYRRQIAGMRVGTLIEYVLVLAASACTFWSPSTRVAQSPAATAS